MNQTAVQEKKHFECHFNCSFFSLKLHTPSVNKGLNVNFDILKTTRDFDGSLHQLYRLAENRISQSNVAEKIMVSYIQISKISLQSIVADKTTAKYIQISKISLQISLVVKLDITRP